MSILPGGHYLQVAEIASFKKCVCVFLGENVFLPWWGPNVLKIFIYF